MYRIMVRKQSRSGTVFLCLLLLASPLFALEKSIELGKGNLWAEMQTLEGVTAVPGRWGFQDLALTSGEYAPDSGTELLLHFDAPGAGDATGSYTLAGSPPLVTQEAAALGGAGAAFTGDARVAAYQGPRDGMFSPGAVWGDFTIEFWLYPATLSNGESIVAWTGVSRENTGHGHRGFFRKAFSASSVTGGLSGTSRISSLSRQGSGCRSRWSARGSSSPVHGITTCVRFDSREGLLEYRLDGVPEAILHTTDTGTESGSIAVPKVGLARAAPVTFGTGFTGFLDEVRVSRRAVADPVTSRFLGKTGSATSRILDLGFSSTRIARIEAVASTPSDTTVEYYYKTADTWNGRQLLGGPTDWVPFTPGTDFKDTLKARYIQLRVELYPDGRRAQSPRLSDLTVVYEPNPPPAPPAGLMATPGNGKVTLTWRAVNDLGVKGYLVYYGSEPHNFLGLAARRRATPRSTRVLPRPS